MENDGIIRSGRKGDIGVWAFYRVEEGMIPNKVFAPFRDATFLSVILSSDSTFPISIGECGSCSLLLESTFSLLKFA